MTTPLWTWDALVAAARGTEDGAPSTAVTGFSIDTRSLQRGDVFVALSDTRDGHDFVTAAFKAGAAAALVRHTYDRHDADGALIRVDDPLRALERVAVAARARLASTATVIAVTGSAGKTGTKEMLRACLTPLGKTHAPEKSFNNHLGVPLTLARMPADTAFAVIEIGMNHAGEIAPLTTMTRPHIAVVTNVLPVHVGNFPDGELGVANAKAEIFAGMSPSATAVLPQDSPHFERLAAAARARDLVVLSFGTGADSMFRISDLAATPDASHVVVALPTAPPALVRFTVGLPGRHLAHNATAVLAAMIEARGADDMAVGFHDVAALQARLQPLAHLAAAAGRGSRATITLADGGSLLLIDESYNANPASMRAALVGLGDVPRGKHPRRIAVLGDMRELGEGAHGYHVGLAPAVVAAADLVFACGPHMGALFEALPANKRGAWAEASTALVTAVSQAVTSGDAVMIKGSLGTNMAPLVAALRSLDVGQRTTKA